MWTEFAPNITLQSRSIGLGSYGFDSHYVSRIIHRTGNASLDAVVREGRVDVSEEQSGGGGSGLGYGCIAINNENEIPVGLNAASQQQQICVAGVDGNYKDDGTCGGECEELSEHQWLVGTCAVLGWLTKGCLFALLHVRPIILHVILDRRPCNA